jgi:DNA repair exonuclease SbcCD nuclease subunit
MEPFRFVHAADLHIDSPFKGLMAADDAVAERLREATYAAFENLIRLCKEEHADFLVVAGDVYDGADRSPRAQIRFHKGLSELAEEGIESFVVHGNHDPLDGQLSSLTWPDEVHIFGDVVSWATARRNGEALADVQGVSYPTTVVTENLALSFSRPRSQDIFNIGILHCNVGGIEGHDNYAPCTVNDLKEVGLDYWALGHVHARQTLSDARPTIQYPGNTQGRDPGEPGARGCMIVDVGPDGTAVTRFQALDVVRWETRVVPIDGVAGIDGLYTRISEVLDGLRSVAQGRDVVCRLTLTGRGPMHKELKRGDATGGLTDELRSGALSSSPWIWIERISDRTRPELDLEARARQDDFLGALLKRGADAGPEAFEDALAGVFSGRRDRLPLASEADMKEWKEEARWYLAELLEPEG